MRRNVGLLIGFLGIVLVFGFVTAGADWPYCIDQSCSAGDLSITRVYVDATDCIGGFRNGTIKVDITPTAGVRYRVRVRANLFVVDNGIESPHPTTPVIEGSCVEIVNGLTIFILHKAGYPAETTITWACDRSLLIKDVMVAWEVNDQAPACTTTLDCLDIGSKCA